MKIKTTTLAGLILTTLISGSLFATNRKPYAPSVNANANPKILIAVDGLSLEAFKQAQSMGLFKDFNSVSGHLSPFPTMTDISWASITHTAELFGDSGRIKTVESTYFDESTQSIQGDPRDYYRRLAAPKLYLNAFEHVFNPYVEALAYFPTEEIPKLEIKSVIDNLIKSAVGKPVQTAYIGAVDSIAHTQQSRLYPLLKFLDQELIRLKNELNKQNPNTEIILMSDHGNVGRFQEGHSEFELSAVEFKPVFQKANLNFTQQLTNQNDVTSPLLALGTWAPLYFKDRSQRINLIQVLKSEEWFDQAVYVNFNNENKTELSLFSKAGDAKVIYYKKTKKYFYHALSGNPLFINTEFFHLQNKNDGLNEAEAFNATINTPYPDSLFRLVESASERNFDFPDLIITLKDGYYVNSSIAGFTKMYRTHGSLSAKSTLGIVVSNRTKLPSHLRSKDILPFFKIDSKELFGDTYKLSSQSPKEALNLAYAQAQKGIPTNYQDYSDKKIFQTLSRFISDTRFYFVVSEIKSILEAFSFDPSQWLNLGQQNSESIAQSSFDITKLDAAKMISQQDIGTITDVILQSSDLKNITSDSRIKKIKSNIENQLGQSNTVSMDNIIQDTPLNKWGVPLKRTAMKLYQIPFLLEQAFTIQEVPYLKESRDLNFARYWLNNKNTINPKLYKLNDQSNRNEVSIVERLLTENIHEYELEQKIYPQPINKIYNESIKDVTVVYVPGTYNAIFDNEIFSLARSALMDDMGLNVLVPQIESACSSAYNADIVLKTVENDILTRANRGLKPHKYLFLGYSKGALDSLHAFAKNRQFVAENVLGLVTIAAPLHGTSILNVTDLPIQLISSLYEKDIPKICFDEQKASKSGTPAAMSTFWRKNDTKLIGLTRYFSVSFESTPEESHIIMKATKIIARFGEPNDGIVTVKDSKFPESLKAVDLGTLKADHLSGILSSRFNQKAFFKGLVQTLAQLDALNEETNFKFNSSIIKSHAQTVNKNSDSIFSSLHFNKVPTDNVKINNTADLNDNLIPKKTDPSITFVPKVLLPQNNLRYDPYEFLDLQKMPSILSERKVTPAQKQNLADGIKVEFNHENFVHFRMEHQFNYESRTQGGLDDNNDLGYSKSPYGKEPNWLRMVSKNNSMRLTTMAYRFAPVDFSKFNLRLAVTKGPLNADPVKYKTGLDDSAFQLWFTIKVGKNNGDRTLLNAENSKIVLFGYYWGEPAKGETRNPGQIFENWYSNKNVVVATLPEAKQLLLNSPDMLGQDQNYNRDFADDLARAFPNISIKDMEIIAITLQSDSNDTHDSSEAYFKEFSLKP
jgi:hypothetical protein